ncbi:MAG: DUF4962 domain-containing protein [Acidobacteriota bacterium]
MTAAAFAQAPDRDPLPDEWGYRPAEGAAVALNPPSFSWVHEKDAAGYAVEWAGNPQFQGAVSAANLPWSVYTHHTALKPGKYWWRYRITAKDGSASAWSRARAFVVPARATVFPQPTMEQVRRTVPQGRPRLFVRSEDLERLRAWAQGGGKESYRKLIARAEELVTAEPTPEPPVRASASDPATRQYWWSNRVQTIRALQEAEILSFAWLLSGERKYGETARRFTLRLAAWDPDGPTRFSLNCEAAKPMLHRLARAYDWAWPLFTGEERARVRAALLRRALDAWNSGEVRQGAGHLNQPYSSHGNRTWHKLAENAIATLGETPQSDRFLDYAVTKFFAAYPVWSDDDGGWHEGLSYFSGYMSKAAWWIDFARSALSIDGFKKPFFEHFGDYAMYSAPPGSPDLGLGDLAHRPPSGGWSFMQFFVRRTQNPHWAWWLEAWKIPPDPGEPVLEFLWGSAPPVAPKAPAGLPPSKVFRGTGVAVLNTNLLGADNVQIRFKSSPMGTWSHGLDPHNSFTLNAYGVPLLVTCVYRDLYGSPFHKGWAWSTRAHNAVLVDGRGQKPRSADPFGRILKGEFRDGLDYVVGDATLAYEGRLTRAWRHVVFVKPDVVVLADELEAPEPRTFQYMLHAQAAFDMDDQAQRLMLDRGRAGVAVDYVAARALKMRQWTGYDPEPDHKYLASVGNPSIPPQWHVEASDSEPAASAFTLTLMRVFRDGRRPSDAPRVERSGSALRVRVASAGGEEVALSFGKPGAREFADVRRGPRQWRISRPE